MSKLWELFERNKLPDFYITDEKGKKVVASYDYSISDQRQQTLSNVAQILKELESLGIEVHTNMEGFPDFDKIVGREELKRIIKAAISNGKEWLDKSVTNKRGVLLYGHPGMGKTYFVDAAAKELEKRVGKGNVVYLKVENIESPYIGETANRVRKMVDKVRELRKQGKEVLLFMDEVDRLAPNRAKMSGSAKTDTTTTMLTAINDLQKEGVYYISATNDTNMLDKAFIDRHPYKMEVKPPSKEEFKLILEKMVTDPNVKSQIDFDYLASKLSENQCSIRDAESMFNLAKLGVDIEGKSYNDAAKEALDTILISKKDQNKTFLS